MQSLNTIQATATKEQVQQQETASVGKQPKVDLDSSSMQLLVRNQHDADSPMNNVSIPNSTNQAFKQLIIYFHTANFIQKIQKYLKPPQNFEQKHFQLIGDRAGGNVKDFLAFKMKSASLRFQQNEELSLNVRFRQIYRGIYKAIKLKAELCFNTVPLLDPSNKLKLTWDVALNLGRIYLTYLIPVLLVFEDEMQDNNIQLMFAAILYLFDMILRCVTIYYEQGLPVRDRYAILRNQIHWASLSEFIGILVMIIFAVEDYDLIDEFILRGGWPKLCLALYFLQLKNLLQFINQWQHSLTLGKATSSIIELIKLIGLLLLILHIFSCFWLVIGNYQLIQSKPNWITSNELTAQPWQVLYLNALYYMSVTMFTVGYGDIHPVNSYEKLFSVIVMFSCTLQLSYSVNTIGNILKEIKESGETIKYKLTCINQFMRNKKIANSLQYSVREYLNFHWYQEQTTQTQEQTEIISQLSEELQKAIAVESNRTILKQCCFFEQNFSQEFIYELLKTLRFKTYQPRNNISVYDDEGFQVSIIETGEICVYEIREGQVEKQIAVLKAGDSLGLNSFLSGQVSDRLVYKANGFVSVLVVQHKQFSALLQDFPVDFQMYWALRNKAETNQIAKCLVCDSGRHNTDNCKLIHYLPDREKVIKGYLFNQTQQRMLFIRNRNRHRNYFNACGDKEFTNEAARMLKLGNESSLFLKWNLVDEGPLDMEHSGKAKIENDSISILIKDIEDQILYTVKSKDDQFVKQSIRCSSQQQQIENIFESKSCEDKNEAIIVLNQLQLMLRSRMNYSTQEIDQIETLVKYLEMKFLKQDSMKFECQIEYQLYKPYNNYNTVLKNYQQSLIKLKLKKATSVDLGEVQNQWLKYMFYPLDFFNQYRAPIRGESQTCEDKMSLVRRQQMKLSTRILKKRNLKRYVRKSLQVYPVK